MAEAAQGHHFDIAQRLSFLEHYCVPRDHRAQKIVRSKASTTRCNLILRLQTAMSEEYAEDEKDCTSDTVSTCSSSDSVETPCSGIPPVEIDPRITGVLRDLQGEWLTKRGTKLEVHGFSVVFQEGEGASLHEQDGSIQLKFLYSVGTYTGRLYPEWRELCWNDGDVWRKPANWTAPEGWGNAGKYQMAHGVPLPTGAPVKQSGHMIINDIVAVGHDDDTDSEASDDEQDAAPVRYRSNCPSRSNSNSSSSSKDPTMIDPENIDLLNITTTSLQLPSPEQSADYLDMTTPAKSFETNLLDL